MSWWVLIPIAYFVYRYYSDQEENERIKEVARIEADLKAKLVAELRDPDLVRQVIEAKLPIHAGEDGRPRVATEALQAAAPPAAPPAPKEPEPRGFFVSILVLIGLVSFLVGLALVASSFAVDHRHAQGMLVGGLISSAAGLALLTFSTAQREIRKHLGLDRSSGRTDRTAGVISES